MGRKLSKIVKSAAKIVGTSLLATSLLTGPTLAKDESRSPKKKCSEYEIHDLWTIKYSSGEKIHFRAIDSDCDGYYNRLFAYHVEEKIVKGKKITFSKRIPFCYWDDKDRDGFFGPSEARIETGKPNMINGDEVPLLRFVDKTHPFVKYPPFPAKVGAKPPFLAQKPYAFDIKKKPVKFSLRNSFWLGMKSFPEVKLDFFGANPDHKGNLEIIVAFPIAKMDGASAFSIYTTPKRKPFLYWINLNGDKRLTSPECFVDPEGDGFNGNEVPLLDFAKKDHPLALLRFPRKLEVHLRNIYGGPY